MNRNTLQTNIRNTNNNNNSNFSSHNSCTMDTRPLIASQGSVGGQDPFYAFKGELDTRVRQTKQKFNVWENLLKTTNTATNREFKKVNRSLFRDVDGIIRELNELERIAIKTVEKQRKKFAYIDDSELNARKKYIAKTRHAVRQLKEKMRSQDTLGKIEKDKRLILMGRKKGNDPHVGGINSSSNNFQRGNQEFLQMQEKDKQRIFEEQDEVIDTLDQGVSNIHAMAIDIGAELDEQNRLLNEFSEDVDTFNGRFGQLQIGMQKLLKTNNNGYLCLILFLTITFCTMLFIYVYS
jgi:hypothetical protein